MKLLVVILSLITTTYSARTFHTDRTIEIEAPADSVNIVLDRFVYEMQTDPNQLFDWIFAGTGVQGDSVQDAFALYYHDALYIPEEQHSYIGMEVHVNGKPRFKDMVLEVWVTDSLVDSTRCLDIRLEVTSRLVDAANIHFYITPQSPTTTLVAFDSHLKFGWFFNIFITRRVYRNVIEWRLNQFLDNLRSYTETGTVILPEEI